MRFLIDQPLSPSVAGWLTSRGHDAIHVRDRSMSSATDADILRFAQTESRCLITADLDFARLFALGGHEQPGLILFRAGNASDKGMINLLHRVLQEATREQLHSNIVVVDEHAIRITTLPIGHRSEPDAENTR